MKTPHAVFVTDSDPGAGARRQLAHEYAELPPAEPATEQVRQADPVVLAQVRFDSLAVLPQEPDEASDSPSATPQCLR